VIRPIRAFDFPQLVLVWNLWEIHASLTCPLKHLVLALASCHATRAHVAQAPGKAA
jgi:hypothetical protein